MLELIATVGGALLLFVGIVGSIFTLRAQDTDYQYLGPLMGAYGVLFLIWPLLLLWKKPMKSLHLPQLFAVSMSTLVPGLGLAATALVDWLEHEDDGAAMGITFIVVGASWAIFTIWMILALALRKRTVAAAADVLDHHLDNE